MTEIRTISKNGKELRVCCLKTTITDSDCKYNGSKVCHSCNIESGDNTLSNKFQLK